MSELPAVSVSAPPDDVGLATNSPAPPAKRWGWVSAAPSEHLIVYRGGVFAAQLGGQGGRFFKRPTDTYVVVPTTLKEVIFQANQVTADFVDVRVRGMVVYRISEPSRICQLINFTRRERGEAKLGRLIADMCRSTAKWLVANMTLAECNKRRKEEIAAALRREVAAVADESWGVEIVTIDIQDVYIQDDALFQAMQATFKAEQGRLAELAELEASGEVERQRLASERALEADRQALALEQNRREAETRMADLALLREREAAEAELRAARDALELEAARRGQQMAREAAEAELERARLARDARQLDHDEEIRALRERLAAESSGGRASLERLFLSESLPALAEAVGRSMEGARLSVYQVPGAEGGAPGLMPLAVGQILDLLERRLDAAGE